MNKLYLPLIAATISAFGQVLLKYAMVKHGPINFSLSGLVSLLFEPRLIVALAMYAGALLMWLQVLSKVPLSVAYPMLAFTYVVVPCLAMFFFDERISAAQIAGIVFVLIGVAIMGFNYDAK
jgi:multidrug transporter EmrE-like cation transporter